jgi:protein TonB
MKPALEFLGFASVATLVHLAVFAATQPDGMSAGGTGGAQDITQAGAALASADAAIAALVARWDTPPSVELTALPPPDIAPQPDALQAMTLPNSEAPRLIQTLTRAPQPEALPPTQPPLPPELFAQPEIRDTPRPRARPAPQPAPQQSRPAPAQPREITPPAATRAAGQGAAAQQGQGQAQTQSGANASASQLAQWGGGIRAAIQRQQRNPGLRAAGIVHLRLHVSTQGRLEGVAITQSSGNSALDNAALRAVQRARLPRAPAGLSGSHQFNLPLRFE